LIISGSNFETVKAQVGAMTWAFFFKAATLAEDFKLDAPACAIW